MCGVFFSPGNEMEKRLWFVFLMCICFFCEVSHEASVIIIKKKRCK